MRVVLQRVNKASVQINGELFAGIGKGFLVLLGIEDADEQEDIEYLTSKIVAMRVFPDADGKMNLSVTDAGGDILIVSQFTLHASTKKGNRPSFIKAARPEKAIPLYEKFISDLEIKLGKKCACGRFGADMQVDLVNDGPVTILLDSRSKE